MHEFVVEFTVVTTGQVCPPHLERLPDSVEPALLQRMRDFVEERVRRAFFDGCPRTLARLKELNISATNAKSPSFKVALCFSASSTPGVLFEPLMLRSYNNRLKIVRAKNWTTIVDHVVEPAFLDRNPPLYGFSITYEPHTCSTVICSLPDAKCGIFYATVALFGAPANATTIVVDDEIEYNEYAESVDITTEHGVLKKTDLSVYSHRVNELCDQVERHVRSWHPNPESIICVLPPSGSHFENTLFVYVAGEFGGGFSVSCYRPHNGRGYATMCYQELRKFPDALAPFSCDNSDQTDPGNESYIIQSGSVMYKLFVPQILK